MSFDALYATTTASGTNAMDFNYWQPQPIIHQYYPPVYPFYPESVINDGRLASLEKSVQESLEKKVTTRSLWEVFIVDPKTGAVAFEFVVAKDENAAKIKGFNASEDVENDYEDYDVLARIVGPVRPKKEVQKVRVVKDEDDEE